MAVAKAKPRKPKRRIGSVAKPRKRTRQQVIASINAQHGVLAALTPIGLAGLAIAQLLPWGFFQDVLYLCWLGNLIGYGFRRFNP